MNLKIFRRKFTENSDIFTPFLHSNLIKNAFNKLNFLTECLPSLKLTRHTNSRTAEQKIFDKNCLAVMTKHVKWNKYLNWLLKQFGEFLYCGFLEGFSCQLIVSINTHKIYFTSLLFYYQLRVSTDDLSVMDKFHVHVIQFMFCGWFGWGSLEVNCRCEREKGEKQEMVTLRILLVLLLKGFFRLKSLRHREFIHKYFTIAYNPPNNPKIGFKLILTSHIQAITSKIFSCPHKITSFI